MRSASLPVLVRPPATELTSRMPTDLHPDTTAPRVTGPSRFQRARRPGDAGPPHGRQAVLPVFARRTRRTVARRDRAFRVAAVLADVVAALAVVSFAPLWQPTQALGASVLVVPLLVPLVNWANSLYVRDARVLNKSTLDEGPTIFRAVTVATVVAYLTQSALVHAPIGAKAVAFLWVGLTVAVPLSRMLARALVTRALSAERVLLVGASEHGARIAAKLGDAVGVNGEVVGTLPLGAATESNPDLPDDRLASAVERLDVHRVLIAAPGSGAAGELQAIQAAKALGVKVSVLPQVLEVVGTAASFDYVDGMTFLSMPQFGLSRPAEKAKRAFDVAGSLLAIVLALPLIAIIAPAIRLTSRGPLFFRQTRIGRNGQAFSLLKFRSMVDGADHLKDTLRDQNEQDGLFKIADDPRITPIGRILRKTSLDELPQLINVLRGEMSLVGPRPLVPEEDRQIQGWHRRRLSLTPGMTGPWQVLGSSRIPLREMVTLDYLYVANWSVWNEVKLLLRTVACVVGRRGR